MITNNLSKFLKTLESLNRIADLSTGLDIQSQIMMKPSFMELTKSFEMFTKTYNTADYASLISAFETNVNIINQLSTFKVSASSIPVSTDASKTFISTSEEIFEDLKESNLLNQEVENNIESIKITKDSKLTFDRLMTIIAVIISIISFIQQQLPDEKEKYLKNIDEKLQILVDIQTSETSNLLKDANNFIQHPVDIVNPKSLKDDSSGQ